MPRLALALLPLLLAAPAEAVEPVEAYRSDRGVLYLMEGADDGLQARSSDLVVYRLGDAAVRIGIETLDLRTDCTVSSSLLGEGRWRLDGESAVLRFPEIRFTLLTTLHRLDGLCGG